MKSIWNLVRHKYFGAAATVAMLIMLPVAIFISQQPQDSRVAAEDTVILSFSPLSSPTAPITNNVGDEFIMNVMLEPKDNNVQRIDFTIKYDPAVVVPSNNNPVVVNENYFPVIINGPIFRQGEIAMSLSNDPDISRIISERTKILSLNFRSIAPTDSTKITIGDNFVYKISLDSPDGEEVVSTTMPAYLKVE